MPFVQLQCAWTFGELSEMPGVICPDNDRPWKCPLIYKPRNMRLSTKNPENNCSKKSNSTFCIKRQAADWLLLSRSYPQADIKHLSYIYRQIRKIGNDFCKCSWNIYICIGNVQKCPSPYFRPNAIPPSPYYREKSVLDKDFKKFLAVKMEFLLCA